MTAVEIGEGSVLARRDLPWREVAGEHVIVDPDGNVILGLNDTGGQVWQRLDGARTLGDISDEIARRHAVDADRVLRDVVAFARGLVDRGLADLAG